MAQRFVANPRQMEIGLAFLRIAAGIVFAMHGYQKFFTMGIPGVTGFFTSLGAPLPHISAIVVASLELFGGIALVLGLLTRLLAIPLAIDMLVAIILFHSKHGFFVPQGIEFVMMLMASCIALAFGGPGALSIDRMLGRASFDGAVKRS